MTRRKRVYRYCPRCGEPVPVQADGTLATHTTYFGNPCEVTA